jgi:23S rRNA pseudouridine2605 synthase
MQGQVGESRASQSKYNTKESLFLLAQQPGLAHYAGSMRLNRFLASAGLGSRRSVEELILSGRVRVNGDTVTNLATQVNPGDAVKVGSKLLRAEEKIYAVLNKPKNVVCSASDEKDRPTIFEYLPQNWPRVFHVGRLDMTSEGLLIVTNDGDLTNALTHPKYKVEKEYEVTIDRPLAPEHREKMLRGVTIEGGRAKAESIEMLAPDHLRIILTQGINRQIHKMFWRAGEYDVKRLVRVRIGSVETKDLEPGKWRFLNKSELAVLRGSAAAKETKPKRGAKPKAR